MPLFRLKYSPLLALQHWTPPASLQPHQRGCRDIWELLEPTSTNWAHPGCWHGPNPSSPPRAPMDVIAGNWDTGRHQAEPWWLWSKTRRCRGNRVWSTVDWGGERPSAKSLLLLKGNPWGKRADVEIQSSALEERAGGRENVWITQGMQVW